MRRVLAVLGGIIAGYAGGAALGAVLVQLLSSNVHDKSVEMAMTAAFVTGPAGAVLGAIASLIYAGRVRGS